MSTIPKTPKCDRCKKEFQSPGALLFSPPFGMNKAIRLDMCVECWNEIWKWIDDGEPKKKADKTG